ncbi:MAG: DNA mismatch repair endonuclease MutL, partial [Bacillota bacterium]|nr:DNA mismatch repair endonuclease MutL [Bacillota bacterium]
ITVTDLFYNTPARLKYMKTIHTELGNITDVVNRLALSHPEVAFRLIHNERKLLQTNGNGDVRQVLASIYGLATAKQLVPISAESLDYKISGYASMPEVTRASRNYISTMINGRFIKNYQLVRAIQEGYHTLLPIGRFPLVLLNIVMDPILVDVNVHPSKMEVRISKEAELDQLVAAAIKNAFKKKELIPTGFTPVKKEQPRSEQTELILDNDPASFVPPVPVIPKKAEVWEPPTFSESKQDWEPPTFSENKQDWEPPSFPENIQEWQPPLETTAEATPKPWVFEDFEQEPETESEENSAPIQTESRVPPLYPIGQMHGTYIFAQNEKGLYIIDQHAAQERLKYEYFREKVGRVESELQELLMPLTLEYSTDEYLK